MKRTTSFISFLAVSAIAASAAPVWMEAEGGKLTGFAAEPKGWGDTSVLSGGTWLQLSVDADKVAAQVPAAGIALDYSFTIDVAGEHDLWNRIGYEFVRSPFEWRVDGGEWHPNDPARDFTQDVQPIATWNEVAWCRLGTLPLTAGAHTLTIRVGNRESLAEGAKPERVLYASDALVVVPAGSFRPNGPNKPGAAYRTAEDDAAAAFHFQLPAPSADGSRTTLSLAGRWEYARWDETAPILGDARTAPVATLPAEGEVFWSSIPVPGDRNAFRPDQTFAHRFLYRTRVDVPAAWKGGSFFLDFERNNLLSSVFVNGRLVATSDACASGFHADLGDALRPGEANEIVVAIKDAYYAIGPSADKPDARQNFNLPIGMLSDNQGVTRRMDFPTRNTRWAGIFNEVALVASPSPVRADDVYVQPSVSAKTLTVDVETTGEATVSAVVLDADGATVLTLPPAKAVAPAEAHPDGEAKARATLTAPWADARLWSPEDPVLYTCRVTVRTADGAPADVSDTRFGFREWKVEGTHLTLNGAPWQMRALCDYNAARADEVDQALAFWKRMGQSMFRMMHQSEWGGMSREKAFGFFDEKGVPVRTEGGLFDGQHASYGMVEEVVGEDGQKTRTYNHALFANVRRQTAAGLRRYRNHPCIFAWVLDNEIIFINTRNFGQLKEVEPAFKDLSDMVLAMDRQGRPTMLEGGRALMDQSLPVNGCHYEMVDLRHYPDAAYSTDAWATPTRSQPWPMAMDKPIFLNEEFFVTGQPVSYAAELGGEVCFLGRAACRPATGLAARMMFEGFRWQELAGWHFWMGSGSGEESMWQALQPTCALVREWTRTLPSGGEVSRTIMVRNDNTFDVSPITFEWEFLVGGASAGKGSEALDVPCGGGTVRTLTLRVPEVAKRTPAELRLRCLRAGKAVFEDAKPMAVLPKPAMPEIRGKEKLILVWEKGDAISRLLGEWGTKGGAAPFVRIDGLDGIPADGAFDLLVLGPDVLSARDSTDPRWASLTRKGARILSLEQTHPLHFQALPAPLSATEHVGRMSFPQNPTHPVFAGLEADDFSFWAPDHIVYRNAYRQPERGANSLVQCGPEVGDSALLEVPSGEGLYLLSQMAVGAKLGIAPAADTLFANLVSYALAYRPIRKSLAVVLPDGDPRLAALEATGALFTRVEPDPGVLFKDAGAFDVVLFDATEANLRAFAAPEARAFVEKGGWLVPWGVEPKTLAAFNELAGTDHILRKFRREKVEIPLPRDPLLSGLTQRDFTLFSSERIFGWVGDTYIADDTFTYVVDTDDAAPFSTGFGVPRPGQETASQTVVNGMVSADAWKYIVYQGLEDNPLPDFTWRFARPATIDRFSIAGNGHYRALHEFDILLDGKTVVEGAVLQPFGKGGGAREDFAIDPPVRASSLTLRPRDTVVAGADKPLTGIDNIWIRMASAEDWRKGVVPLLNVGALVRYPRGQGGILLNQLAIPASETVPVNVEKKRTVLAALLRNLGVEFAAKHELRPGDGLVFRPVSFEGVANLYLTSDKGFPDKACDLSLLPLGAQTFAGVDFEVRDFRTSPLESGVAISGLRGVRNLPKEAVVTVKDKADALFFLHTMYPGAEWKRRNAKDVPPVLFEYVVTYADGKTESVPVVYADGAATYHPSDEPSGLPGATLAWSTKAPESAGGYLAAYYLQWNNLRPDVAIESVTLKPGPLGARHGSPILLGLTLASQEK